MITRFRLENFKAHRDTDLALRQFTVLVGDNGSGKTSVLAALRLVDELIVQLPRALSGRGVEFLAELPRQGADRMAFSWNGQADDQPCAASLMLRKAATESWIMNISGEQASGPFTYGESYVDWSAPGTLGAISRLTGPVALYRFHSDQIAASAYSDHPAAAVAEDGALTAVALAALKLADDDAFERIETAMRKLVPSLQRIFIKPATVVHPSNPN